MVKRKRSQGKNRYKILEFYLIKSDRTPCQTNKHTHKKQSKQKRILFDRYSEIEERIDECDIGNIVPVAVKKVRIPGLVNLLDNRQFAQDCDDDDLTRYYSCLKVY